MQTDNTFHINCIYCDDIRQEVSGKITVVGMYSEAAPVNYPLQGVLTLPKLCIIAKVRMLAGKVLKSLRFELKLDDDVLHGVNMPAEIFDEYPSTLKDKKWMKGNLLMEFGNFPIPRDGVVRLVAIVDGDQIHECTGIEFMKIESKNIELSHTNIV